MGSRPTQSGSGGVIRPRPIEKLVVHPFLSLAYRTISFIVRRLGGTSAVRFSESATRLMIRPFRPIRFRAMRLFLGPSEGSEEACVSLDDRYIRYQGRILRENIALVSSSADFLRGRIHLEGEEHVKSELAKGTGVVILCTHVGNWLLAPALLSLLGYKVSGIAYEIPIQSIESHMKEIWKRFDITVYHPGKSSVRKAKQALDRNEILVLAYDASVRPESSVWMPFDDIAILADPGPARLVSLLKPPVLRLHVRPHEDSSTTLTLMPEPVGDGPAMMTAWLGELHREIRARPELWWPWSFVPLGDRSMVPRETRSKGVAV
ncbi:MAG: lysophospholipid acyltransferase family protein [Ignavibacteria bacterium]|nr:lysophospholipid acyltransferase family protein [Ignavibacteria bacterium]